MKFNAGGGGSFVKLGDKESIVGIFKGDPYEFKQHYDNATKKGTLCPGTDCPKCAEGSKPAFRFRLNLITYDGAEYKPWILEQGWNFYQDLKALHEGDHDLEKTLVKITRNGTGNGTRYTIFPTKTVSPEDLSKINQVKLLKLEKEDAPATKPSIMDSKPYDSNDDIPF